MTIGTYLRHQRERRKLSLREMSRRTGIPHITIWKLECDQMDPLLRGHLAPIASAYRQSVVTLLRNYHTQRKGRKTNVR